MAYDEFLAKRIDDLVKDKKTFSRKEMFGGVGYLYNGNMCIGVYKDDLIIRYDPKLTNEITSEKNVRPFDITGRPMKGWSLVNGEGAKGNGLKKWFDLSFSFVKSLPPKK
jgi:hypothetical protein